MMEALLNTCVDAMMNDEEPVIVDEVDNNEAQPTEPVEGDLINRSQKSATLKNKLDRLCLATFDSNGEMIEAVGSLKQCLEQNSAPKPANV